MRAALTLVVLALCLGLWLIGLWLGRPWPVTLHLGLPEPPGRPAVPAPPLDPAPLDLGPGQAAGAVTLAAGAGRPMAHQTMTVCSSLRLVATVTQPFGARRGLTGLALGWRGREEGWGVLAPDGPPVRFDLTGQGRRPGPDVQLTSLGGLFDGTGTLEVSCGD